MTVISGPIPLYANVPMEPQFYSPWKFVISNIALGATTTVTMVIPSITNLNYVIGQQIRLLIPPTFGCRQLNNQTGYVIAIPSSNQVVVDIYSAGGDPFFASSATTKPQILAIGDVSSGPTNASGRAPQFTLVPGSFINISPN